ncbi:MAG: M14 family zinc carboxypeptidase, partial [Candidatus Thermoplasmatota archaeon]|nr:M14 family zinc carboxypeptidase [Candidatus Thermoplasmatota archaeon]
MSSRRIPAVLAILCILVPMLTGSISTANQDDPPSGLSPEDIWSDDYANHVHPWGGDDRIQFKAYHDYFTMRDRMMELAEQDYVYQGQSVSIMSFHEGLNGGTNARGVEMTANSYEGHFYSHSSPWMKITGGGEELNGVDGGECNDYVGDCGNYADIPDVQMIGNFHAREWMSYEVPMMFLEIIAHYYGMAGIDNDGDGSIDEDTWGDSDGDGQLDDDGDCLSLASNFQDSNGDGIPCGPGDLGVDEDFSEQQITDLVNTREIYLVPMLNVDGNRYDREVFCGEDAWNCDSAGWRKNLRDNGVEGVTPIPDLDEEIDESCDGVDLNRNFQYEWGAPLGATGPLLPGMCYAGGPNNDVYNGPVDDTDNDGDGQINEDHVDGNDDDADGITDEDWWGGNSEPETLFVQDLTEMNDDDNNGASDFKATLSWHSYSELVLYPWGHCTDCETPDHDALIYHGDKMAEMTLYANIQSSDLYPTTGDYCDWQYGVHDSFCYTIEIGTAFHQQPDDVNHIAVRNVGIPFYMLEISDN